MDLMNGVLRPYLGSFIIDFIDDLLTYLVLGIARTSLRVVLEILKVKKLYAKFLKYEFGLLS